MKFTKALALLFMTLSVIQLYPEGYTLKKYAYLSGDTVYLSAIIEESVPETLRNIEIATLKDSTTMRLDAHTVLSKLFDAGIKSVTLSGDYVICANTLDLETTTDVNNIEVIDTPVFILKKHIESFIDTTKYDVDIQVLSVIPEADLHTVYTKTEWSLPLVKAGLADIPKFSKLKVALDNKSYTVRLTINIYANVLITKEFCRKDEKLSEDKFIKKRMDISSLALMDTVLTDFGENNFFRQPVQSGSILRSTHIMQSFDIRKGDSVLIVFTKGGIRVELAGVSEDNGYNGSVVKVKLSNGTKVHGYLRSTEHGRIVEVN